MEEVGVASARHSPNPRRRSLVAEVPAAAHATILRAIRNANADVIALRKATNVKTDYKGFQLVETTLAGCHVAISGEQDQARVVKLLKTAARAVALFGGGDVAPAAERTIKKIKTILQALEAKSSTNK